mmetsp:Transcript_97468/g.252057  ORF Transcript_97468/g.252057 Transcript_97468/m.252057 type:complete len:288 (+) Transcript_97468:482-1345(+)
MLDQVEIPLEVKQQVSRWHGTACEEVPRHPIRLGLCHEVICEARVHKDVHKETTAGLHHIRDTFEQSIVILHVFHHLDRDHAIEPCGLRARLFQHWKRHLSKGRFRNIASDDVEVGEAPLLCTLHDPAPLSVRIGDADHKRVGVALCHEERARAPTATEVQDGHTILHTGSLRNLLQRPLLRLRQQVLSLPLESCGSSIREDATRILLPRPKPQVVQLGWHLVVLLVSLSSTDRDGHLFQLVNESHLGGLVHLNAAIRLLTDLLGQLHPDAEACGPIREEPTIQHSL